MSVQEFANLLYDLGPAVANHLWQSTAFAGLAAALAFALRKNEARARYWIWMTASLKFVIPFALLAAAAGRLAPAHVVVPANAGAYMAVDQMTEPFVVPAASIPTEIPAGQSVHWGALAFAAVWAVGFCGVLTTWCVRWRRVARVVRSATPVSAGREIAALERIATEAGVRQQIRMRLSDSALEPGVFGVLRPVLLWPAAISERLADEQLDAVLAHEVCHVRRRDNMTAVLHMFVEAVFWFHPLVWWMGARLLAERERACDEAVVAMCPRAEVYAQSILKVCEFCVESPLACVAGITGADLKRRVTHIMTGRASLQLSYGNKAVIVSAAVLAVAVPISFGLIRMTPLYEQILHPSGPLPSFEVASIRPWQPTPAPLAASPNGTVRPTLPMRVDPAAGPGAALGQRSDRVHFIGNAHQLIAAAYNLPPGQENKVIGAPEWATQQANRYEVQAKIEGSMYAAMQKMPPADQRAQVELMEQSLLLDRFKLKAHFESREMTVYALIVLPGGPKLIPAKEGETNEIRNTREDEHGMETMGAAVTLDQFVHSVMLFGGRLVVDQTGLKGKYDFRLTWQREQPNLHGFEETGPDAPPLSTALREQLGLKLEPSKAPVEVIVIDHIERPTPQDDVAPPQLGSGPGSSGEAHTPDQPSIDSSTAPVAQKTTEKTERYEAATVKLAPTRDSMSPEQWRALTSKFGAHVDGTLAEYTNMSLMQLISEAFGTPPYAIAGPDWLSLWTPQYFDVVARMPDGATQDDAPKMLQALLTDRFHLQIHREMQMKPVLAMIVAKDGPKLKPSPPTASIDGPVQDVKNADGSISSNMGIHGRLLQRFDPQTQTLHLEATKLSMDEFADRLTALMQRGNESKRRVVNETGLKGDYQIMIDFSIADQVAAARAHGVIPSTPGSPQTEASDPNGLSTLVSSVKKLGLDLQPRTALVPVLVVDQADRIPTQN